ARTVLRSHIIDFASVAGGEDGRLGNAGGGEAVERLELLRVAERGFIAQTERRLLIAEAPHGKLHSFSPFFCRGLPPKRFPFHYKSNRGEIQGNKFQLFKWI